MYVIQCKNILLRICAVLTMNGSFSRAPHSVSGELCLPKRSVWVIPWQLGSGQNIGVESEGMSQGLWADATSSSSSFFFSPRCAARGILVPWPGIEPGPSAVKVRSPNHWIAREFPDATSSNKGLCWPRVGPCVSLISPLALWKCRRNKSYNM